MAEFITILKLFAKLYPMLKSLVSGAGELASDIRINRENNRIEVIFESLSGEISDEEIQDAASTFNDQFR